MDIDIWKKRMALDGFFVVRVFSLRVSFSLYYVGWLKF